MRTSGETGQLTSPPSDPAVQQRLAGDIERLLDATRNHAAGDGQAAARSIADAATPFLIWLRHLEIADEEPRTAGLLNGARAALVESVAAAALGLGRACIAASRLQIDLVVAYTYYRSHLEEWERVQREGKGFVTRGQIQDLHCDSVVGFKSRLALLNSHGISIDGLYRALSAHIHGQSDLTITTSNQLEEVVFSGALFASVIDAQTQTLAAVSHYLCALYADDWPSLPPTVIDFTRRVLTRPQRVDFFDTSTRPS